MLILLIIGSLLVGEVTGKCDNTPKYPHHGKIHWIKYDGDSKTHYGTVECDTGYELPDNAPQVSCVNDDWVVTDCILKSGDTDSKSGDTSKIVEFGGMKYNYTEVAISGGNRNYPLMNDLAYVFIARYTASKMTPTVRVHVGLIGSPNKPVLINIQQSSESIGFELPYKVVSSDNRQPKAPYTSWVTELCPGISAAEEDHHDTKDETVEVHVRTTAKDDDKLKLSLQVTAVQHMEITDIPSIIKIKPTNQAIYRYTWADGVKEVEVNFGHVVGAGEDVCATASIRTAQCPIEEMGASSLTFTRQGSFTLNKDNIDQPKLKDGFIIVLTVLPDDWRCRSSDREKTTPSREKTVTLTVTPKSPHMAYSYLFLPALTCAAIVFCGYLFITQVIDKLPANMEPCSLSVPSYTNLAINCDDKVPMISNEEQVQVSILPPFDRHEQTQPKQVDLDDEDGNPMEGKDMEENGERTIEEINPLPDANGVYSQQKERDERKESMVSNLWNTVVDKVPQKYRDSIVTMTQGIGHHGLPVVLFFATFDNVYDDIKANLDAYSVKGDQDACYFNAKCAFPTVIQGYRIPDVSRITSNIPYIFSGLTFLWIVAQKRKATLQFDAKEKGIRHDFSLFSVLALITVIVGFASSVYHTCPNESTSRIDMFFIEMYLAYVSLKIYQSRTTDIRRLFYVPGVSVTVLGFCQRLLGLTHFAWFVLGAVHILFTVTICLQLFFLGTLTLNPITVIAKRHELMRRISNRSSDPSFRSRAVFFAVATLLTITIALTGMIGLWKSYAMYNVIAISADIVVYFSYYIMMKYIIHKERLTYHVVMLGVACAMFWTFSICSFLAYKSTNTALSPAESRCYNKDCIIGPIEGHDLWHCLSAVAIFLTNVLVLTLDDDLINTPTDEIEVF